MEPHTTSSSATPEQKLANFTLAVSILLHSWPALSLAVQNGWGSTSESEAADKREWFAGAVVDLFTGRPGTDQEDVEDMLAQVMGDEYEVGIEDGSEILVASKIMRAKEDCDSGDFAAIRDMYAAWQRSSGKPIALPKIVSQADGEGDGQESDAEDDDNEEDDDEGSDVEMDDRSQLSHTAPGSIRAKRKPDPEIDEDGFTKVVGRNGKR